MTRTPARTPKTEAPRGSHGLYAIVCRATGEVWIGVSGEMDQARAQAFGVLRSGAHPNARLAAAFQEHGEAEFRFEELDRARADLSPEERDEDLRRRRTVWSARLQAEAI